MSTVNTGSRESLKTMLTIFGFVLAFDAIAIVVAWPIYANPFFVVSVGGAIVAATVISWLRMRFAWSRFTTMLIALGTYLVLALPLTSPSSLTNLADAGRGWLASVSGIVLSWKQLVTIDLPVGTYQSLLVPAFLTFFVLNLLALTVAWSSPKLVWFPVIPMLLAPVFGIAFGYAEVSRQIVVGGLTLPIALGTLGGIATLALALAYLSWGVRLQRRTSLSHAASSAEAQPTTLRTLRGRAQRIRRVVMAVGVVGVTAMAVATTVTVVGVPGSRDVLRSGVDPDVAIRQEVSPLSEYRKFFTNSTLLTAQMFTLESQATPNAAAPNNIRLAVLPYYNGQIFTVIPTDGTNDVSSSFAKVASDLPAPTNNGDSFDSTITIGDLAGADNQSIWLPIVGAAKSVSFDGANARELTDAFYANRATGAAVVVDASGNGANILSPGSTYRVSSYADSGLVDVATLTNPGAGTVDPKVIPQKLVEWCATQTGTGATCYEGMSGADFATLIGHLRARGYLSHELLQPQSAEGQTTWLTALAASGYTFAPSLAGHSTRHIDDLFAQLLDRQNAVGVDQPDANLVAAVGDDEQFAAATALLANHVGFPARVVVGFRTVNPAATNTQSYTIPACDAGACLGENLSAWVEIQGNDGKWAALDVTPQFANPIAPLSQGRQDPKNETQVIDQNATVIPPSQTNPSNGDGKADDQNGGLNLSWLWDLLKAIFVTLLVIAALLSPFALIIGAKLRRRQLRRNAPDTTRAIVGAWEEYVDELVDAGYAIPRRETRRQLALSYASATALDMATRADEAVFGPADPRSADVIETWNIVQREREERREGLKLWDRIRLELSVRSFLRYLAPRENFSIRQVASSMTGAVRNIETGRVTALFAFVGREIAALSKQGVAWVRKEWSTRVGRKSD